MTANKNSDSPYLPLDVCVLIPCYNNFDGLIKSLKSIHYDKQKLIALVVDDGSKLPIHEDAIIQHLDRSILFKVINLPCNKGITEALNTGLLWADSNLDVKYIARLDCGDLCHKERFYKQVKFLDSVPDVGLLGSWCTFQSPDLSLLYEYTTPTDHKPIVNAMHSRNVFIHPTVMFRAELIKAVGLYPHAYPHVEDYAYFWQMLKVHKGHILNKALVTCEVNPNGISMKNRKTQLIGRMKVVKAFGSNWFLKMMGVAKISLLAVLPYNLILKVKSKQ